VRLVIAHELEPFRGIVFVSRANQAAAFDRISRSSLSWRFSRRSRLSSSRSAVVRPPSPRPALRSDCANQFLIDCAVGSNSRASSSGDRPARTSSTIWRRNSGGEAALVLPIVDSSNPNSPVSTKPGQLHLHAHLIPSCPHQGPGLRLAFGADSAWGWASGDGASPARVRQADRRSQRRQLVRLSFARAKKLARAAECLVYSLTPSGFWAENHPKIGVSSASCGSKMPEETFSRRSPVGEWSRGARSMPRVFGRGSRSQPAALVSDRDPAHLFLFKLPPFVARWSSASHSV